LDLNAEDNEASFVPSLNMFGRLEELDLINFTHPSVSGPNEDVELNLPMLTSIRLDGVSGIDLLTLDAHRLKTVELRGSPLRLKLVHADSVEWLTTDLIEH